VAGGGAGLAWSVGSVEDALACARCTHTAPAAPLYTRPCVRALRRVVRRRAAGAPGPGDQVLKRMLGIICRYVSSTVEN
jgi:hypothetical protein